MTGVTFRVWAPNAAAVRVAGEFNGWNTNGPVFSNHPISKVWNLTDTNARPGQAYKYLITTTNNTVLWKKDPRAREVRTLGSGVPSYVTSGSSEQASVIYDPDSFDWEGDNFVPPWPNEIVMYELHVGTFYDPTPYDGQPATFDDAIKKLDYLKELGINMIALMPVQEFNGRHSWGYNPSDPFAIEETYGGPEAFKRFVKAAHQKGIAVQVDVVHNHYGENSSGKSDLENFDGGDPYFYHSTDETSRPGIRRTKWGPRPRYSDTNVQAYILDNIKMYLDEYKVWALRWDSPRNITGYQANPPAEVGDPDTEIPEAVALMEQVHQEISSTSRSNAERYYSIAEDANVPGGYTGHWEISFHNVVFPRLLPLTTSNTLSPPFAGRLIYPALNQRNTSNIGYRLETKELPGFRVIFSENHDKCGDHNTSTDGLRLASDFDPANPESVVAKKKSLLTAAVTLSSAGTPMLWMGQEQLARGDFKDTTPLDWKRAARFPGLVRFHRDMIRLRRNLDGQSKALTYTGLPLASSLIDVSQVVFANETNGVIAYDRWTGTPTEHLLVAVNFSAATNTITTNFPYSGPWRVYLNSDSSLYDPGFGNGGPVVGTTITTTDGANNGTFVIAPWSVLVFGKSTPISPSADANNNGMDDGWEILFGATQTDADPDKDGFSNLAEYQRQTDPTVPDRIALAGNFNEWDIETKNMRWDPTRSVWRYVGPVAKPGEFRSKAYLQNWAPGDDFIFLPSQMGTYEITYSELAGNYSQARVDMDGDSDGMADVWEAFWFYPSTAPVVAPGADPDGDGMSNLLEFQRGSDPTAAEYPSLGVVGEANGWNWNVSNMKYVGHGLWAFFRWAPQGASAGAFKITRGPTNTDPNWGADSNGDGRADFMGGADFSWPAGTGSWQGIIFNEKNQKFVLAGPGNEDVDNDGQPDAWERFFGLDPFLASDGVGDQDNDAVLNLFEYQRGSSPIDPSDHYAQISIPGDKPRFLGDSSDTWLPTNARRSLRWNANLARWEGMVYFPTASNFRFKFVAGDWNGVSWGWNSNGVTGQASRWPSGPDSGNISHLISAPGYYVFRFEEHQGTYTVQPLNTLDLDQNNLPDEWVSTTGAANDPNLDQDGDSWSNRSEFLRGTDPKFNDPGAPPKRMTIAGGTSPLNWIPNAANMTWNDQRMQWEWTGTFASSATLQFKFSQASATDWSGGDSWGWNVGASNAGTAVRSGADNILAPVTNGGRYRFSFNDLTGIYTISNFPVSSEWWETNGLPAPLPIGSSDPRWSQDTDGDGNNQLMEYVLGGNPNVPQTNRLINSWTTNQAGTNRLVLRWNERTNAATVQPQWQTDLVSSNWTNLTPSDIGGVTNGMQSKEASVPIDSTNRKFLRLRVTGP